MKLSMWIVYDWLKSYDPNADIKEGKQTISGVRYLADDVELSKEYLYIGYSDQYIDKWDSNVICVNGTDLIALRAPDIYVIFNEIQMMLEFYNNWETGVLQAINEGKDLNALLALTTTVLKTGVAVSDFSLKVLGEAHYNGVEEKQQLKDGYLDVAELRFIHEQLQANLSNRHPYIVQTSVDRDVNFNLYSRSGRIICRFISLGGGQEENVNSRMQITESFGQLLNLWFMIHEPEVDHAALFLDALEGRETDPGVLSIRLEGIGWGENANMRLLVLQSCVDDFATLAYIVRALEANYPGVISLNYEQQYILIVNLTFLDENAFWGDLRKMLKSQMACCGCSLRFSNLNILPQNYRQACFAAEHGGGQTGGIYLCEDYAVAYMQNRFRDAMETDMTSPALMTLKEYDRENGTEYYQTLFAYLRYERNQTLAAQKLFIHRNSLLYRINRIREIIHVDLNNEMERRYLLLSYFIKEDTP